MCICMCCQVLIETSWNVKALPVLCYLPVPSCINRNIVECKESRSDNKKGGRVSINRNIVECKGKFRRSNKETGFSINRNIVECKVM